MQCVYKSLLCRLIFLVPLAVTLTVTAAAADPISLRIEVFGLAGLRILTLKSSIDERPDRYAITTEYATSGIAGWFVELTSRSHVEGRLGADPVPELFRKDDRRNGVERQNKVNYLPGGGVEGISTPAASNPVTAREAAGTVDNLTAYFRLERQLAKTGSCALTVPVFDGRHRYDLIFRDAGKTELSPSGGQRFQGPAIACQMERRILGMPDAERDEGARGGTIWYARLLSGTFMVPVRMQMETQLGVVDGYLAELRGGGVDLHLME